jgi:hypothetical protein
MRLGRRADPSSLSARAVTVDSVTAAWSAARKSVASNVDTRTAGINKANQAG